ncbi:isocitrate dehydrogenase (NAD(+)) idh1 [Mortierella alpina]|uniref:Isocitrate dehydrogenase (NAD(+)) idh1 n=1 Tax=Mortierella alpina TaxID=64518 RepID=A0A9P6M7B3_MORAP|nr:isocitrate dehydrogenase (NAD(+)) idh1 [Mortierella alpina]
MSTSTIVPQVQDHPHDSFSKLGGRYTVTLIPGDGIGQETAAAVKTIFKAAHVPVDWEQFNVSGYTSADDLTFKQSVESLRRNKVGLKGILYTPTSSLGHSSFNVTIRKDLDMYASLVLCKNIPGYPTRHEGVDFAIIRENTEGEYSGLEHQSYPGVVESLKPGCRHVGKDIQGRNSANPSAMILSSVMMLRHLGLDDHANRIANAVSKTILNGAVKTPDMGGSSTTTDFTFAVISNL